MSIPPPPPHPEAPAAPPAPASPGPDVLNVVADAVDGLRDEVAALGDQFRRRLLNDRETRRSVEELHQELDHTRKLAEGRTVQPLLYDLVLLLDRVERETDPFADSVRAELSTVLEKYGMTRMPIEAGVFNPATQEAVGTVPALSPDLVGHVARIVRHGYAMGPRLIRAQQVLVHAAE
ncbi:MULTISPECIES: nucleotide exchange factor GrpE [unclassified Streptomyces]|uniref:nucleotide exchange factor GrpE n=1 Tax=unclassified Streptomyces TaxID=2593676 RepID=UPI0020344A45|nr:MULTISPECIES: nucleotide exchange factor GrpE [unclassified Streptomyces]MCM2420648.1 nucleotide exchange factor GrpE [Streptomyces sp. RKAG293]MCM2427171.1 nucleotide exchange factor GrpE [Streptomyces sp. RKAG337]